MHRYKLFVIFFLTFAYLLAAFVFINNRGSADDRLTESKLSDASRKVDDYVIKNDRLPDTAGSITVDKRISYKKYSNSIYVLCANFSTAKKANYSSSSDALSDAQNQELDIALQDLKKTNPSTNYIKSATYIDEYSTTRIKGQNCYVVLAQFAQDYNSPTGSTDSKANINPKCNQYEYKYEVKNEGSVDSINKSSKTITFSSSTTGSAATQSLKYDDSTQFYDIKCTEVSADALKKGDKVTWYLFFSDSEFVDQVEL